MAMTPPLHALNTEQLNRKRIDRDEEALYEPHRETLEFAKFVNEVIQDVEKYEFRKDRLESDLFYEWDCERKRYIPPEDAFKRNDALRYTFVDTFKTTPNLAEFTPQRFRGHTLDGKIRDETAKKIARAYFSVIDRRGDPLDAIQVGVDTNAWSDLAKEAFEISKTKRADPKLFDPDTHAIAVELRLQVADEGADFGATNKHMDFGFNVSVYENDDEVYSYASSFCAERAESDSSIDDVKLVPCGTILYLNMPVVSGAVMDSFVDNLLKDNPELFQNCTPQYVRSMLADVIQKSTSRVLENYNDDGLAKLGVAKIMAPSQQFVNYHIMNFHRSPALKEIVWEEEGDKDDRMVSKVWGSRLKFSSLSDTVRTFLSKQLPSFVDAPKPADVPLGKRMRVFMRLNFEKKSDMRSFSNLTNKMLFNFGDVDVYISVENLVQKINWKTRKISD